MTLIALEDFRALLRCPCCCHELDRKDGAFRCSNRDCAQSHVWFPSVGSLPALVDFERSVLDPAQLLAGVQPRQRERQSRLKLLLRRLLLPSNLRADRNFERFRRELLALTQAPIVLVVGGGAVGDGALPLYTDPLVRTVGFDIYGSENVQLLADAHQMPFADASFDGVWIQAVLEHVLQPETVVAELRRVLRPEGIVYAETPFLQGVHEAAYDFTRFTDSGHRWLFRDFERIGSGAVMGPFAHLLDAVRGATLAITGSSKLAILVQACLFWLKPFDRLVPEARRLDHASAVWFLGRRASQPIGPKQAIAHYAEARSAASAS